MKKVLAVLFLMVLVFSVSMASADGKWHYCDLCARQHSGTICPEQCINECELNAKGVIHKWYDCPYRTISTCWYCGEETEIHNENCCPNGEIIWSDYSGTFKSKDFAHEEGARYPRFCKYCGYYGYHDEEQCRNRPIEVAPTLPGGYVHDFKISTSVVTDLIGSEDVCRWETARTITYCETCRLIVSEYVDTNEIGHDFDGKKCVECGFKRKKSSAITNNPSTPQPISTPTPTPIQVACGHNVTYPYTVSQSVLYDNETYCHIVSHLQDVCVDCGNIVEEHTPEEFNMHDFAGGICQECGYKKSIFGQRISFAIVMLGLVGVISLCVYAYRKK